MAVGPTLLPIFQQLGIYDAFIPLGKRIVLTPFYKESLESYRPTDHIAIEELYVILLRRLCGEVVSVKALIFFNSFD